MKPLLTISLLLNLALAGTVVWFAQRPAASHVDAPTEHSATAPTAAPAAPKSEPVAAAPTAAPEIQKSTQSFDWRMVESEDYKKYITNLRAIGCPEETIRDIITADVTKLFDSRRRGLAASTNKFQYWKAGQPFGDMMNPERLEKTQELSKEKRALLKELLGVEPEEKFDMFAGINPFETMLDFLPASKQNSVMDAFMKYQAKVAKLATGGAMDADDMKAMQKLQKEMDAELAGMMTPEEFESYQLRMSNTAMSMRMQLASFDPTEKEFRDIFAIKKKFDDEFGPYGMSSSDKAERDKYNVEQKAMNDRLKTLLGDRYPEYERAQDYMYQTIYRITERNGLPKDTAVKVYEMKKTAEHEATKVRQDPDLTREQRQTALQGIRTETEKSLQSTFGPNAWKSYNQPNNTYWLNNISREPTERMNAPAPVELHIQ